MADDGELARRKNLTFRQAEGLAPLPEQLQVRKVSQEMRVRLYRVVHDALHSSSVWGGSVTVLGPKWQQLLADYWLEELHLFADAFPSRLNYWLDTLKTLCETKGYGDILGFFQFALRHPAAPASFRVSVEEALAKSHAAYRVIEYRTIVPIASEAEGAAVAHAFSELGAVGMKGASVLNQKLAIV